MFAQSTIEQPLFGAFPALLVLLVLVLAALGVVADASFA
jgi:hypothetical protein